MKLGILGQGKIVKEILPVIEDIEEIELVAIAARDEAKLKDLSHEYGIKRYYTNIDDLINDDEVKVVYIGLPNDLHYEAMKKAIEAGKDIICEKPFTTNLYETEKIIDLANNKDVIVLEALNNRFIPNALKAKDLVEDLGQIKLVSFNYSQYSSRYDNFKNDIIEPVFSLDHAGGALMDLNIYNVSYIVDLFALPKDVKYFANIEKDIDTSGVLVLDYEDFKAVCIGSKDTKAPITNTIQGTRGSMEIPGPINNFEEIKVEFVGDDGQFSFDYNEEDKSRLYYEFVEFVKIIKDRDKARANELLEKTRNYMEVLTKARFDANIYYPSDRLSY